MLPVCKQVWMITTKEKLLEQASKMAKVVSYPVVIFQKQLTIKKTENKYIKLLIVYFMIKKKRKTTQ